MPAAPISSTVSGSSYAGGSHRRGGEEAALKQARLARILQHSDWDGRSPRLWLPPAYDEDEL